MGDEEGGGLARTFFQTCSLLFSKIFIEVADTAEEGKDLIEKGRSTRLTLEHLIRASPLGSREWEEDNTCSKARPINT